MSERASIHQSVQIGYENTEGQAVAATRRLASVSIEMSPKAEVQQFKAGGSKHLTTTAKGKEWSEGSISGVPTYNEILALLPSNYGAGHTTDLGGGAFQHELRSETFSADTTPTMTVEMGSDIRAHRATGVRVTDLTLAWNRPAGSQEISGTVRGKALTDGVAMSTGTEALNLIPITAEHVTLYLDSSQAALGTTALNRAFSVELAHTGRFAPVWALKGSEDSYVANVETDPTLQVSVTLEADAQGMSLLTALRNGTTKWLRIEAVGPVLGSTHHMFRFDAPCRVSEVQDFSDQDGVYAIGFTLTPIYDEAFDGSHKITVVTDIQSI